MAYVLIPPREAPHSGSHAGNTDVYVIMTMTCQIIIVVLHIVKNRKKNCLRKFLLVFGLHCQCKQLQTSPAALRGYQAVCTIQEIACRHTGPTSYTMMYSQPHHAYHSQHTTAQCKNESSISIIIIIIK